MLSKDPSNLGDGFRVALGGVAGANQKLAPHFDVSARVFDNAIGELLQRSRTLDGHDRMNLHVGRDGQ